MVSIADIAIFPFIRQFAFVDKTWFEQTQYSYLRNWLNTLLNSELFYSIMNKYPCWRQGDASTIFSKDTG